MIDKTLTSLYDKYSQIQPYDFAENPFHIEYIPEKEIHSQKKEYSDISVHMPFLRFLSSQCKQVVEFGVREGCSTVAILIGGSRLTSYDINKSPLTNQLSRLSNWTFIQRSSIDVDMVIPQTDLLFIDSCHTFEHVRTELYLHSHRVRKWIAFHDVVSCRGVREAKDEFLRDYNEFTEVYLSQVNHGLAVIQRRDQYE